MELNQLISEAFRCRVRKRGARPAQMNSPTTPGDESRFIRLVNELDHAIVWEFNDTLKQYTFVSDHSQLVLGYAAEEWLNGEQGFEHCMVTEDLPAYLSLLSKLREGDVNDLRMEHRCMTADGRLLWLHTGIHSEVENDHLIFRGVSMDINSVKASEERERLARQAAEESTRNLEAILAVVSHDVNTPLNSLVTAVHLLQEGSSDQTKVLATLGRSANRLSRLIADLVDMANIRSRQLQIERTDTITDTLLQDAVAGSAAEAAERKVTIKVLSSDSVALRCDPSRIAQVLTNLVNNAIKFTSAGGTIEVCAQSDPHEVYFSVSDDGVGIASEDLQSVFERHWQVDKNPREGRGLGLFIAQGIVEAHAGRIWAESTLGEGSRFVFTLPHG